MLIHNAHTEQLLLYTRQPQKMSKFTTLFWFFCLGRTFQIYYHPHKNMSLIQNVKTFFPNWTLGEVCYQQNSLSTVWSESIPILILYISYGPSSDLVHPREIIVFAQTWSFHNQFFAWVLVFVSVRSVRPCLILIFDLPRHLPVFVFCTLLGFFVTCRQIVFFESFR